MTSNPSYPAYPAAADFGRTRWSMVVAVRSGSEAAARQSLAELCRRYWVPVYAWVRRCGHPPESSAALVQSFLSHMVHELRAGDPAVDGGFRVYLQRQLQSFLSSDWTRLESLAPLQELAAPWPLAEVERRQQREQDDGATPQQAFQRAFALELLEHGLDELRQEAERGDRGAMFDALRPFLAREPGPGEYVELAHALNSSPLAVVVAVRRLRQRYQELIDSQLAQTVGGPEALTVERDALLALLASGPT